MQFVCGLVSKLFKTFRYTYLKIHTYLVLFARRAVDTYFLMSAEYK